MHVHQSNFIEKFLYLDGAQKKAAREAMLIKEERIVAKAKNLKRKEAKRRKEVELILSMLGIFYVKNNLNA